jgi:site-specific DNA-cytosine methylase
LFDPTADITVSDKRSYLSTRKCGLFAAIGMVSLAMAAGATCAFAIPLTPFRYESQAQRHCPGDVVVWLDFRKEIYYSKRIRGYGQGFTGAFVCQKEARAGGYRRSLLGLR